VTEQITVELSRFRDVLVIARNSTLKYKNQPLDVREVGRALGARYVLVGSLRKAPGRIRVTAQLVQTATGAHLWADTYDSELNPVRMFSVQDDIAHKVVATIADQFGVISRATFEQARARPTDSLDAYDCVLHAHEYYRSISPERHLKVRACLERAVELDPDYVDAWALLAYTYVDEHRQQFNPRPGSLDRALKTAQRAVSLDHTSQLAHDALAVTHFFRHELDLFFAEAERTIALNPNNAVVVGQLGLLMSYAGWWDRGVALVRKAMALSPNYPTWYHFSLGKNHYRKGEYKEALTEFQKINMPDYFFNWVVLAYGYAQTGRMAEAQTAIHELRRLYPGFTMETFRDEYRKWNFEQHYIGLAGEGLRKAGLTEQ
jgi:TolB-like protein/tetratricopeptide (TPR) repeat protein